MSDSKSEVYRPTSVDSRMAALDGLRGIAIVVVVLSHGWLLFPIERIDETPWLRPIFRSGNVAVSIFLVAAGYLTYRTLARRGSLQQMRPGVTFLRRLVRVGPTLLTMLVVVMVVSGLDPNDPTTQSENRDSVLRVLTYTYNWFAHDHILRARTDFGHLWYLSVEMQAFIICAALLFALRRRTWGVVAAFTGFLMVLIWWRFYVADLEIPLIVMLRTTVRMDAFVLGVLLGAVLPLIRARCTDQRLLERLGLAAAVALIPLAVYASRDERFLRLAGTLVTLDIGLLIGVLVLTNGHVRYLGWLSNRWLAKLGEHSLLLYVWHFPAFHVVFRNGDDWPWPLRVLAGCALTLVAVAGSLRLVEPYAARMYRSSRWRELDDGLLALGRRHEGGHRAERATSA